MRVAGVPKFSPELDDHLIQRACGAVVAVAPDFVQQEVAGQHFADPRMEDLEELQFAGSQFTGGPIPCEFNLKTAVETPNICKPINLNEFNCSAVEGFGEKPFYTRCCN